MVIPVLVGPTGPDGPIGHFVYLVGDGGHKGYTAPRYYAGPAITQPLGEIMKHALVARHIKLVVVLTLKFNGSAVAHEMPSGCVLVPPVQQIIKNDRHLSNTNLSLLGGPFCVQDEVVVAEVCVPVGVVAGAISITQGTGSGMRREEVLPGISGPHCKLVKSYVRPDHSGTGPNYQCLTRAVSILYVRLSPLTRVAICAG
jgi:hypothetical protein